MLEALERGVKGGKWFALIDKVYEEKALRRAFAAVQEKQGAAGSDGQSVQRFAARLADLQAQR
jgi:RNA-directed DNA polymerase